MAETAFAAPPARARSAQGIRRLIGLAATAALTLSGVVALPLVAQAAETPSFSTSVTEVPDERIDVAIEGAGYGDVQALPGQTEPHAYFTLIEKGSDLANVGQADTAISASVAEGGTVSDVLTVPAGELDATTEYEIISWPSRSFPTEQNLYARADVTIDWAALFPSEQGSEPQTPSFTADVTEVPDERIDVAIEGTGYGDVPALPGQTEPHAYFTLVEKGSDLANVGQADTAISASIDADGNVSDVLTVPADELDATTAYEVISWPSRSFPTEDNLYARADIAIDWAELFPEEEPSWDPQLTVSPATELNPEGDTVTVSGTGYNPAQGLYVFLCQDVELPADLWQLALTCRTGAALVTPNEDGTFELDFAVQQLDGPAAVYTAANHTGQSDRSQDAKAALAFAETVEPQPAVPSFTAEVTEVPDERIDVAIEGTGYGDVQALPGQTEPHAYFTLVEKGSNLADVGQADTAISASIDADGNVSEVLTVPAGELDAAVEYEVISWPSRSFPTEDNLYARADVTIDWAALFPEEEEPEEPEEPQPATPSFTADVTEVPDERIDVAIEGTGYGDVQALPGQTEPHAYFTLVEKGSDLANVGQADTAISASIDADGNVSDVLTVPAGELDASAQYEVVSWPSRSFPTEENLYARGDITIDWATLFPEEEEPEEPQPEEPKLTLTGADGKEITSVTQGDEITFSVGPVDAGTEFEVTIQSDPITLPDPAVAGEDGIASASWTVPTDLEPGEHTVTFASATASYSASFEVQAADDETGGNDGDDDSAGSGGDDDSASNGDGDNAGTGGDDDSTGSGGDDDNAGSGGDADAGSSGADGGNGTAGGSGTDGGNGTAPAGSGSTSSQLAVTGADGAGIALSAAALLMLLGAGVLVLARRRTAVADNA